MYKKYYVGAGLKTRLRALQVRLGRIPDPESFEFRCPRRHATTPARSRSADRAAGHLIAQAGPAFDVISIKPNRTNQGIPVVAFQPGGRMIAGNVVVRQVILVAYGLEDVQLVNAPDWTATERFAIEARTADDTPTNTIRLMLRAMLADRFGFAAHQERRELPMYALTMARPDKRLGARFSRLAPSARRFDRRRACRCLHRRHRRRRKRLPAGFGLSFRPTNLSGGDAGR